MLDRLLRVKLGTFFSRGKVATGEPNRRFENLCRIVGIKGSVPTRSESKPELFPGKFDQALWDSEDQCWRATT